MPCCCWPPLGLLPLTRKAVVWLRSFGYLMWIVDEQGLVLLGVEGT